MIFGITSSLDSRLGYQVSFVNCFSLLLPLLCVTFHISHPHTRHPIATLRVLFYCIHLDHVFYIFSLIPIHIWRLHLISISRFDLLSTCTCSYSFLPFLCKYKYICMSSVLVHGIVNYHEKGFLFSLDFFDGNVGT
ncbi:hypothetical protein DL96DRAFT_1183690 [Flagelloscypha sp. PMI_526]|nr:hypothetical protein DL96DRAFT_1183690 [Flagelloscypha sp. PMI_526]